MNRHPNRRVTHGLLCALSRSPGLALPVKVATVLIAGTLSLARAYPAFAIPINLAPLGTATGGDTGFGSSFADGIDGNRDGEFGNGSVYHSASPASLPMFYEVDLGSNFYLDRLQIFPRTSLSQLSVENFRIDVFNSDNDNIFTKIYLSTDSTRERAWGTSEIRNVLGDRVRLTRLDGSPNIMTFAEFEVFGQSTPILPNVALGGVASATDVLGGSSVVDAIDGDINGFWRVADTTGVGDPNNSVYHSASQGAGIFWQVDLGQEYSQLDYINLFSRVDNPGFNARNVQVEVLASDGSTVNFTQNVDLFGTDLGSNRYDQTIDLTNVGGQFVRVTALEPNGLTFGEIEVFAIPEPSTLVLGALGTAALGCVVWRKKRGRQHRGE